MATKTSVDLRVNGIDQTRAVFASIRTRMAALGARLRVGAAAVVRGLRNGVIALGAATAGLFAGLRNAANQMSVLTDRAAQAGTSAQRLNGLVVGLGVAGAKNANLESVADALSRMTKATGATGVEGFQAQLQSIAALETEGERIAELSRIFGRAFGPGLAALVRQGPDAIAEGLAAVDAITPKLRDDLVNAGDAIADSMNIAAANTKAGWNSAWMDMAVNLGRNFGVPAEEVWARLGAYVRYGIEVSARYIAAFGTNCVRVFQNIREVVSIVFGDEGIGGMIRYRLRMLGSVFLEWAEVIGARFVWLKDVIVAAFSDETFDAANRKYREATERARDAMDARNASIFEDFGEASFARIGERLRAIGIGEAVDISDLRQTLDETLAAYADGAIQKVRNLGLADAAQNAAEAIQNSASETARQFGGWTAYGSNAARKIGFSQRVRPIESQMLDIAKRNLGAVEDIAGTMAELEAI